MGSMAENEHQVFSAIGYYKGEITAIKKLNKSKGTIHVDRETQLELKAVGYFIN